MTELWEIRKAFIKATYEVSIEHSKKSIANLEEEQKWELTEYAKEKLQELQDEYEWLLSNDEALEKYLTQQAM
ncbi:hypothetical protein KL86SPO_70593 [uncultured Sporomusa sp.]|uniref:Uncharacterized protein n=1 Tax=uncultured Sporomusa sp. TaxID=307249 RepID=A0A212M1U3_9FIRM|nr:hypothetical protein [uncultured Sporomusa sp.]SCM83735.1 hypothetical protein KL86SPO_70593 [uncultured Sporomusa sp.]